MPKLIPRMLVAKWWSSNFTIPPTFISWNFSVKKRFLFTPFLSCPWKWVLLRFMDSFPFQCVINHFHRYFFLRLKLSQIWTMVYTSTWLYVLLTCPCQFLKTLSSQQIDPRHRDKLYNFWLTGPCFWVTQQCLWKGDNWLEPAPKAAKPFHNQRLKNKPKKWRNSPGETTPTAGTMEV